jgi:hypothetical protein
MQNVFVRQLILRGCLIHFILLLSGQILTLQLAEKLDWNVPVGMLFSVCCL